jgi:hypothetical protein
MERRQSLLQRRLAPPRSVVGTTHDHRRTNSHTPGRTPRLSKMARKQGRRGRRMSSTLAPIVSGWPTVGTPRDPHPRRPAESRVGTVCPIVSNKRSCCGECWPPKLVECDVHTGIRHDKAHHPAHLKAPVTLFKEPFGVSRMKMLYDVLSKDAGDRLVIKRQ